MPNLLEEFTNRVVTPVIQGSKTALSALGGMIGFGSKAEEQAPGTEVKDLKEDPSEPKAPTPARTAESPNPNAALTSRWTSAQDAAARMEDDAKTEAERMTQAEQNQTMILSRDVLKIAAMANKGQEKKLTLNPNLLPEDETSDTDHKPRGGAHR